jgi:hypothetical protein
MSGSAVTVTIENGDKFIAAARKAPEVTARALANAIKRTIIVTKGVAVPKVPVDRGDLAGRWRETYSTAGGKISGTLENTSPYASYVHGDGTKKRSRPHWPPLEAIEGWAKRHGVPPYFVQRSISRKGTPLIPFLKDAVTETEQQRNQFFKAALESIVNSFRI